MGQTLSEKMRPCFCKSEYVYGQQRHSSETCQNSDLSWSFQGDSLSYQPAHETPKSKYESLMKMSISISIQQKWATEVYHTS